MIYVIVMVENEFSPHGVTRLSFNIWFTEMKDMNTYLIALENSTTFNHAYGDVAFQRIVDHYYSGPNKQFGIVPLQEELRPENQFRIDNEIKSIIRELKEGSKCNRSVFTRWINPKTMQESVSFFCIGVNSIEKHEFDTETMEQISFQRDTFPFANFIDYYVIEENPVMSLQRSLQILSKEGMTSKRTPRYFLHRFVFTRNLLRWRRKDRIK